MTHQSEDPHGSLLLIPTVDLVPRSGTAHTRPLYQPLKWQTSYLLQSKSDDFFFNETGWLEQTKPTGRAREKEKKEEKSFHVFQKWVFEEGFQVSHYGGCFKMEKNRKRAGK